MNFYRTIIQRQQLLAAIEQAEGELTPELEEALQISDERLQEDVLKLLGLRETALSNVTGAKAEIARLQEFVKANERAAERFTTTLTEATQRYGTINAGTFRLSIRRSMSVQLAEGFTATAEYGDWVEPQSGYYKPDKTAIRKALEADIVLAGASLEPRVNLQIK